MSAGGTKRHTIPAIPAMTFSVLPVLFHVGKEIVVLAAFVVNQC
jgi:hypothetical protein